MLLILHHRPNAQPTAATAGKASGGEGCKGGGAVVGILGDRRSLVAFWYGATLVFNYTCALFLRFMTQSPMALWAHLFCTPKM